MVEKLPVEESVDNFINAIPREQFWNIKREYVFKPLLGEKTANSYWQPVSMNKVFYFMF